MIASNESDGYQVLTAIKEIPILLEQLFFLLLDFLSKCKLSFCETEISISLVPAVSPYHQNKILFN